MCGACVKPRLHTLRTPTKIKCKKTNIFFESAVYMFCFSIYLAKETFRYRYWNIVLKHCPQT